VAVHCGMDIMAIVAITNMNLPDCMEKTSIDDVIATAKKAGSTLACLWEGIVEDLKV
jgi:purine-nucleoside phosphorylase